METKDIFIIFFLGCSYVESRPGIGGYHGGGILAIKQQGVIPPVAHVDIQQVPAAYDFSWAVKDSHYGNDFGHQESRDGYDTTGSYYVLLPDGRLQNVKYFVNGKSGFVADVSYDGEAIYPAHSIIDPVIAKSDQIHHVKPFKNVASQSEQYHHVRPFKTSASTHNIHDAVSAKSGQVHHVEPYKSFSSKSKQFYQFQPFTSSASTKEDTVVQNFNVQPKHNLHPITDESFPQDRAHDGFQPTANFHDFQTPASGFSNLNENSAEVDVEHQPLERVDYTAPYELGKEIQYLNKYTK